MKKLALVLGVLLLSATSVVAEECSVKIQQDLRLSNQALAVLEDKQALYEIRQHGYLSIGGEPVKLSSSQRAMAEQYAGDLAAMAARWIIAATEALELTSRGMETVLSEALGPDDPVSVKAIEALEQARSRFEQRSILGDGAYLLHATDYNDLGESMEDELEDVGSQVTSALLTEIGKTIRSDELSFKQKLEAFGASMRRVGEEIGYAGKILEDTSVELCLGMGELRRAERKLQKEIPQLEDYSLFR
ncbi:MAG: DUF2884 family protein [Halieaceae bacterium]